MDCSGPNPKRSAVDGLPEDSLVEILARVPTRSVCRSKCVAKGWRDLIEDPLHGKKIPQTLQGFFSIDEEIYGRGCGHRSSDAARIGFTSLRASSAPLGIDGRLSFLTKLRGIQILTLADSCNGLLLFEHGPKSGPSDQLGYIVCNPATKHWVSVRRYVSVPSYVRGQTRYTYLVFDPVVSSHFHIVQFWYESAKVVSIEDFNNYISRPRRDHEDDYDDDDEDKVDEDEVEISKDVDRISVHVYSSETGTWSHIENEFEEELGELEGWRHQGVHAFSSKTGTWSHIQNKFDEYDEELGESEGSRYQCLLPYQGPGCAVLNGMLHFIISGAGQDEDQIVAIDVQGETQRIIPLPAMAVRKPGYIAQSQGRLHYISQSYDAQLFIWVLEDAQKWVLKHSVSFVELFGKRKGYNNEYEVVAMHPDGNVVFIVQNQKLISYNMDHKLKNVIATSEDNISADHIVPYVPCFVESPALTNKN